MELSGLRKIVIPKLTCSDVIRNDTKETGVKIEEAHYQRTWRLDNRCTDHKQGESRRERVIYGIYSGCNSIFDMQISNC